MLIPFSIIPNAISSIYTNFVNKFGIHANDKLNMNIIKIQRSEFEVFMHLHKND